MRPPRLAIWRPTSATSRSASSVDTAGPSEAQPADTVARSYSPSDPSDANRLELAPDLLGDALGLLDGGAIEDGEELLATEPGDDVARPQAARQDRTERAQDRVADDMSVLLVELPEMVEIEQDHRDRAGAHPSGSRARAANSRAVETSRWRRFQSPVSGSRTGGIGNARVQLDVGERQRRPAIR